MTWTAAQVSALAARLAAKLQRNNDEPARQVRRALEDLAADLSEQTFAEPDPGGRPDFVVIDPDPILGELQIPRNLAAIIRGDT